MSDLITLSCPNCGGQLRFEDSDTEVRCEYCTTDHLINFSEGEWLLRPIIKKVDKMGSRLGVVEAKLKKPEIEAQLQVIYEQLKNKQQELNRKILPRIERARKRTMNALSWGAVVIGLAVLFFLDTTSGAGFFGFIDVIPGVNYWDYQDAISEVPICYVGFLFVIIAVIVVRYRGLRNNLESYRSQRDNLQSEYSSIEAEYNRTQEELNQCIEIINEG